MTPHPTRRPTAALAASLLAVGTLVLPAQLAAAAPTPSPLPSGATSEVRPGLGTADPKRATFGVQPVTAGKVDRRPYLSYVVTPGASISDHVAVVNYGLRPLDLSVYATDALNDDHGGFALLPADQAPSDAGRWVAIGTSGGHGRVVVPARSQAIVPVRVTVPVDAAPGDHVAGVLAALAVSGRRSGISVRLDQRVAARVYVRVAGPLHPRLVVDRVGVHYSDELAPPWRGRAEISYRVRNAGNVKLGGSPTVSVHGLLGASATTVGLPRISLLLPGSSVVEHATVRGVLPELLETARVSVTPLVVPGDVDPGLAQHYTGSARFVAVPWAPLAALLVVAVLLWGFLRRRRRPALTRTSGARHARTRERT